MDIVLNMENVEGRESFGMRDRNVEFVKPPIFFSFGSIESFWWGICDYLPKVPIEVDGESIQA